MRMKALATACFLSLIVPIAADAGTTGWSYSNYTYGSYVPLSGTFRESISHGWYYTQVDFSFTATNVNSILDYNNGGDNPGTACDGSAAYVTLDVTDVPISDPELEGLNALYTYSNLPNPKFDVEDDWGTGPENEESEVVALGTVQAGVGYYFDTTWEDLRTGQAGHSGNIQVQFAMSNSGFLDYNNCTTAGAVQVINPHNQYNGGY